MQLLPELAAQYASDLLTPSCQVECKSCAGIGFAQQQQPSGLERSGGFPDQALLLLVVEIVQHIEHDDHGTRLQTQIAQVALDYLNAVKRAARHSHPRLAQLD